MISLVANLYILAGNAKTAHWNIQGSRFYGLHKLLDEVDEMLRDHGDKFAERMRFHSEMPDITLPALRNLEEVPDLDPSENYEEQMESIVEGLNTIHDMADKVRGEYGPCEDSMLDFLQESVGKYVYQFTSILS